MVTLGGCLSNMSNGFTSWWVLTTCITSQVSKESAFCLYVLERGGLAGIY